MTRGFLPGRCPLPQLYVQGYDRAEADRWRQRIVQLAADHVVNQIPCGSVWRITDANLHGDPGENASCSGTVEECSCGSVVVTEENVAIVGTVTRLKAS